MGKSKNDSAKRLPSRAFLLMKLFGFLVRRMLAAMSAIFLKLKPFFKNFLVLAREIVDPFAFRAFHLDQIFLGHIVLANFFPAVSMNK